MLVLLNLGVNETQVIKNQEGKPTGVTVHTNVRTTLALRYGNLFNYFYVCEIKNCAFCVLRVKNSYVYTYKIKFFFKIIDLKTTAIKNDFESAVRGLPRTQQPV